MQIIKKKTGWIFALFAVFLLGIQSLSNSKMNNDIDSIFLLLDRLSTKFDKQNVQSSEIDNQIAGLSQQLTDLRNSLASSTPGIRLEEEPQEVILRRDRLQQQNLNLQNEILRLRASLDEGRWSEDRKLEQFQQPGSAELVTEQILELQRDLAQINTLEKLAGLDDRSLDIFVNGLANELASLQDNGSIIGNRQIMLEALGSTRDQIAGQITAEQLEIIDTYIGSERFRTFVLAPGSNGSAGADSLVR